MDTKRLQELAGIKSNQTAVEWLIEKIAEDYPEIPRAYREEYQKAKAMEKEQMIDFAKKCSTESAPDEYYEEMYNNTF